MSRSLSRVILKKYTRQIIIYGSIYYGIDKAWKKWPKVEEIVKTSRMSTDESQILLEKQKKDWTAKDRKTIKTDPDIKSLIEIFSNFDGTKEYETVYQMAKFYLKNNYDEHVQQIITNIQDAKFIH